MNKDEEIVKKYSMKMHQKETGHARMHPSWQGNPGHFKITAAIKTVSIAVNQFTANNSTVLHSGRNTFRPLA